MKHFVKYANVSDTSKEAPILILYDGHKSHISLTLTDWAKKHNVILFVLLPHTSHVKQPLDVGVFGPSSQCITKSAKPTCRNILD